jgi:hypothetical protein
MTLFICVAVITNAFYSQMNILHMEAENNETIQTRRCGLESDAPGLHSGGSEYDNFIGYVAVFRAALL